MHEVELSSKTPATVGTLKHILDFARYPSQFQALRTGSPEQMLLVGPGRYRVSAQEIDPTRQLVVSLLFYNDLLKSLGKAENPDADSLQIMALLPFSVPTETEADVLRLITLLNSVLPLGHFGLDPAQGPYYRYDWKVIERNVDGLLLIELMGTILFFLEHLAYRLESVATGQKSVEEASQEDIHFAKPDARSVSPQ
ncbi:MAG: hypothetical protein CVV27_14365 [Candidatus Melainabacteria bacterium HGW-Melainabacteria-1]|nr:MAG: hypothetical protein CVV27_14365 [Candidatus Melainabacteria bacterium HGW-Melainabacteria-1]